VGIDEARGDLLPEDKLKVIEAKMARGGKKWAWWATASTTHPPWRAPTSALRWALPAPTPRSKPPTWR
jgi:hypothetical protein